MPDIIRCRTVPKAAPMIHAYPPNQDNEGCQTVSTENTNFLVIDRKGRGENLIIHKFEKENIILNY